MRHIKAAFFVLSDLTHFLEIKMSEEIKRSVSFDYKSRHLNFEKSDNSPSVKQTHLQWL